MSRNRQRREAERLTFSYGLSKPLALQVVRSTGFDGSAPSRQAKSTLRDWWLTMNFTDHFAVQISRGELDETEVLNRVYGKRMIADNQDKAFGRWQ